MKTIYVTHPVATQGRFCLVVRDEADLKAQLAERERIFREQTTWAPKVQRDKGGKPEFHEMSKDWPEDRVSPTWDPNS